MAERAWRSTDVKGLTPALDPRRSDDLFAIGGKNFAFTSLGPRSIFGDRLVTLEPFETPNHIQGLRVRLRNGDRSFLFPGDKVLEWDEENREWVTHFETNPTNLTPFRWTSAYVNGILYFCHPVTGILFYNLETEVKGIHNGPGVPPSARAICSNSGRLVVMDDIYLSWSWQSDGMNFTPALGEAGQQKINDRVAGFPIMINSYAEGIITWTTGGMMQSQFTGDEVVYRHRNLNTEYRPINSFCTLQTDENTAVILDERGLFESKGAAPTPMAPLFNEFLIEYIRQNKLSIGQNLRIEWDDLRRLMYVMVSVTENYPQYEKAFVLYPPLDKWGIFDEPHLGIMPIHINWNQRGGHYFGYVDLDGRLHFWDDFASREKMVDEIPTRVGLDAKIHIGLVRFPELGDSLDRMTEVNKIMIGNVESGPEGQFSEDYLTEPGGVVGPQGVLGLYLGGSGVLSLGPVGLVLSLGTTSDDYNTGRGNEDYGIGTLAYVNHGLKIIGTLDGREEFMSQEPTLVSFNSAGRHFACSVTGVWHIIEITATNPGEAFHLRAFELNAVDAGRLS